MHAFPASLGYRWSDAPKLVALALLFAGLVRLLLDWFSTQDGLVALVWAPSGVALAALLLWGRRFWLGIFAGSLLHHLISGTVSLGSLAYSAGHALEALLAAWLLQRWLAFDHRLEHVRDYFGLLLAAVTSAAFAALLGGGVVSATGGSAGGSMLLYLLNWWQGDALGMVLVTPFLLIWAQPLELVQGRWRRIEAFLLAVFALVIGGLVFLGSGVTGLSDAPRIYLVFALLPWAVLRFGRHGTSLLIMLAAVLSAIGVLNGSAAFGPIGGATTHYNMWIYLLVLSVVGITSALTLKQLRRAEWRARTAQAETQTLLEQAEQSQLALESTLALQLRAEAALAEQNAFLETMLDNEPECVKLLDAKGRLLQMNRAGLGMLEVDSVEQARETGLASFVQPEFREAFKSLHRRVCAGESGQLQFRIVGRRGTSRWLETHAVSFRATDGDAAGMLAVTRDISRRKYAEARDGLQSQVMRLIATGERLSDVLSSIVAGVESLRPDCRCSVLLLDADGRHLHVGAAPSLPAHFNAAVDGQEIGPRAGSCGTSAWRGERVVVSDVDSDPLWSDYRSLAASAEVKACWSEPIMGTSQRVLGTFATYHRQARAPDSDDIELISSSASLAAIAIERCQAERELRESERRYQRVVDNISDALLVDDAEGRITFANERFLQLFGLTRRQLSQLNFLECVAPELREELEDRHRRRIRGEEVPSEFEFEGVRSDGARMWLEVRVAKVVVDGVVIGTQSLIRDITEQKRSQALIWQQANFDELTGMPNRRMLRDRLEQEIKKSKREGRAMAVLLIDLDRFKEVNDTLGHDAGDLLLVEAAHRIHDCVRETDVVARLGGDEFVVAIGELEGQERVDSIAQDIIARLAAPFLIRGEQAFVSASIGITLYPDDASGVDELLKHADQAMYVAKDAGRNRFSYFTPALQVAAIARLRLTNDLRRALGNGEFRAYFQPVVDLSCGRIVKAEALIRWQHPQRGMVSPADFIPLAESSGLIFDIGDWIFQQAAFWAKRWRSQVADDFQVSVNQSPLEFQREGQRHLEWLAVLRDQGLSGQALVLEITEGLLLDASTAVNDKLIGLSDAGVQVALDDFGTGYSSLAYLKEFDIDYLKVDQRFTRNLAPGSSDMALTEAIIVMAHKLGMRVIAEGVETEAQRDLLAAAGCDYGQGWLFGRPVPAMEFDTLLRAQHPRSSVVG